MKIFKRLLGLVLAAVIVSSLCACSLFPTEEGMAVPPLVEPTEVSYKTHEVTRGNIIDSVRDNASFVSTLYYSLSFEERGGYLSEITVGVGNEVKKDQQLARLDTDDILLQIEQQQISCESAALNYNRILSNSTTYDKEVEELNRQFELKKIDEYDLEAQKKYWQKEITDQGYALAQAKLSMRTQQLALQRLQIELDKSVIKSPVDGVVTAMTKKNVGDYISAREMVLTVTDPTSLILRYSGPQTSDFKIGLDVNVSIDGTIYKGTVVSEPESLDNNTDSTTKQPVYIEVENIPDTVFMGKTVIVELIRDSRENVIVIPQNLIQRYAGQIYVLVLEDGVKVERLIELGVESTTQAEVISGLEEGDLIIVQ